MILKKKVEEIEKKLPDVNVDRCTCQPNRRQCRVLLIVLVYSLADMEVTSEFFPID